MYDPKVTISKRYSSNKPELKNWILLNTDLKTPRLLAIGGESQFDSNQVMYCIVRANSRNEAMKFMKHIHPSLCGEGILEPMIVEIKTLEFTPAAVVY